ncbi:modulator of apoptosis 1-like [Elysia marginata]|uniref:Modulator of apoptosis 1-like n=1 Tax=Elysia marginata TaxID=1093978 RepID=A0AAV4JHK8_9GAST|nr:modulator of apoptosis 1-like [Elysia marginata]
MASEVKREGLETSMFPRLPIFSGEDKDTDFDVWHFDLQCLIQEQRSEADIKLAARSLISLGVEATVPQILSTFEALFSETVTAQTVLRQFYSIRQGTNEDAGTFALRLQNCIQKAVTLKRVRPEETNELLKEAYEGGLQRATRAATAYLFTADRSFDKLQLEVKRKERELGLLQPVTVAAAQDSQLTKLAAQINQLQTEIREIQKTQRPRQERAVESLAGKGQSPRGVPGRQPRERGPIQCWRCGQRGHVHAGCRNQTQASLNPQPPAGRGRPQARYH